VVYRILLFYIGSLVVLLALYPWVDIKADSSPFVMIFHNLNSNLVASALNFVILVASLSVYNSGVYSNSRMLFGLSVQGNAPAFLTRVSRRGVPVHCSSPGRSPRWWCWLTISCQKRRLGC
jgi:phenylalanine-specific permease